MDKEYVYNRVERIKKMKDTLEVKLWDLEDLNREILMLQDRIKLLEDKEGGRR